MPPMSKSRPCVRVTLFGFQHFVMLLLLLAEGEFKLVGPPQPILAFLGDEVVLPCHLQPAVSVASMNVEWGRLDLQPRFVHVWHNKGDFLESQNTLFEGRTSMLLEKLQHGDLSLTLSNVTIRDTGTYRCYLPDDGSEASIQLIVGSTSSPLINGIQIDSSLMALTCMTRGWFPEPELSWWDRGKKLPPDGATEISLGPDGLYAVRSQLSVKEDYSRSITCRVTQRNINQIKETRINISAPCPPPIPGLSRGLAVLAVCLMFPLFIVFGHKTAASAERMDHGEEEMLEGLSKSLDDLRDHTTKLKKRMEERVKAMVEKMKELKPMDERLGELKEKQAEGDEKVKEARQKAEKAKRAREREEKALPEVTERELKAKGERKEKEKSKEAREREEKVKEARENEEKTKDEREKEEKALGATRMEVNNQKRDLWGAAKAILDENNSTLKQRKTDDQQMISDIEQLIKKIDDFSGEEEDKEADKVEEISH